MSPPNRGLRLWLHTHPTTRDGVIALILIAVGLPHMFLQKLPPELAYKDADALNVVIVVASIAVLTLRQRYPLTVLACVLAGEIALTVLDYPPAAGDILAFLIAVYTVAAHRGLAHSALGGVIALAAFFFMISHINEVTLAEQITNVALLIGVWWLGRGLRLRRAYLAELEHRAMRLERARGTDARAARVEERSRIARELHDVVAHHVSVMTVQAGAARRILDKDPERTREALSTIEEVGRTALSEMRRIVGVLRTERDAEPSGRELAPQPGVHDIGGLVDQVRETGLSVQLWIEGELRPLSPGVDLAAFRLVQEALTNTLKHAGPQARAWVRLNYGDRQLTVDIEDDGRGVAAALGDNGDRPGHGLVGMYERVALYGGELRIGPRKGGGFEVRARFPLEA
ncbi:sensor histidine kinase [Actinomadura alba]|nr:sensor histidine kinase [Actinomadura alba]